jgi:hypothetical protein
LQAFKASDKRDSSILAIEVSLKSIKKNHLVLLIQRIPKILCPWRYKCFIVLFGPWRYNGYKHVTPLGSFLYYTFRNKLLQRNTAPERCVHRVKNLSGRRREASRLYIYLFSGHSVSFSSNTFCAVPSKIPLPN